MHAHSPVDLAQWKQPVRRWESLSAFLAASSHETGLHSVAFPDGTLDVSFYGRPLGGDRPGMVPVIFSGATKERAGALGPYFSGQGISTELGTPSISIADATISDHGDLKLAWYAGCSRFHAERALHAFLAGIVERYDVDLLLIGGSGGGFAALSAARAIGDRARVLSWNPQTDLLAYEVTAVTDYLHDAFPESLIGRLDPADPQDREVIRAYFEGRGITTLLGGTDDRSAVLMLQNTGDWHLEQHATPYATRRGMTVHQGVLTDGTGVVGIGDWGGGHSAPPRDVTLLATRTLLAGASPQAAFEAVARTFPEHFGTTLAPLRDVTAADFTASATADGYRIDFTGSASGLTFAFYVNSPDGVLDKVWYKPEPGMELTGATASRATSVSCFVRNAIAEQARFEVTLSR